MLRKQCEALSSLKTVYFSKCDGPRSSRNSFASREGEMCPVRLCLRILPDASLPSGRGFSAGSPSRCLGTFGFYSNVAGHAGSRSESCGIGGLSEVSEVPTMMTTVGAARAAMPGFGIDVPPNSLAGRRFHTACAIMTRENCCHDGSPFLPRNPVFWGSSRIFCHICVSDCSMGARNPLKI